MFVFEIKFLQRRKTIILFFSFAMCLLNSSSIASSLRSYDLPEPLTNNDFHNVSQEAAKLGQLLFYDKLLSGNRNIACSTCHHTDFATADGLALGLGEGAEGIGDKRKAVAGVKLKHRVPRHSPVLFNLGAKEISVLFHDGRLRADENEPGGFNSPAEEFLPDGLKNILAAQALFPLVSAVEMAGDAHENEVTGALRRRIDYAWAIILERIRHTGNYAALFQQAYPEIKAPNDIQIYHVANALSDFINIEWRADQSPFDEYLRGDELALSLNQKEGMELFYGKAACAECHSGALLTNQKFYALALPQFGPGRTRRFDFKNRDMGRINETDLLEDRYHFRTPSLRNVVESPPYGHNGAYSDLEAMIRHHINPLEGFDQYDPTQLKLTSVDYLNASDFLIWQDRMAQENLRSYTSPELELIPNLTDIEILQLIDFLSAFTDQKSLEGRLGVPAKVPSGLSID